MTRRAAFALTLAGLAALLSSQAHARCAPVAMPQEVRQSAFVVEAILVRAGETAQLRTVTVWKGGAAAPATFELGAQQGRGRWPWADAANVGRRYLVLMSPAGSGYSVARCGQTGEASDAARAELRALGLTPLNR